MNQHIARAEVDSSTTLTDGEAEDLSAPGAFDPRRVRETVAAASTATPRFLLEPLDEIILDLDCEQAWNFGSGANLALIGSLFHPS